ncbi:MAG TPA: hypothetical protein VGK99_03435, partial [Acidobacteriota bacterium]
AFSSSPIMDFTGYRQSATTEPSSIGAAFDILHSPCLLNSGLVSQAPTPNVLPLSRERRESQVAIEPQPPRAARRSAAACYAVCLTCFQGTTMDYEVEAASESRYFDRYER